MDLSFIKLPLNVRNLILQKCTPETKLFLAKNSKWFADRICGSFKREEYPDNLQGLKLFIRLESKLFMWRPQLEELEKEKIYPKTVGEMLFFLEEKEDLVQETVEDVELELEERMKNSDFALFMLEAKNQRNFQEAIEGIRKHKKAILSNTECLFLFVKRLILINNEMYSSVLGAFLYHIDISKTEDARQKLVEFKDKKGKNLHALALKHNNPGIVKILIQHKIIEGQNVPSIDENESLDLRCSPVEMQEEEILNNYEEIYGEIHEQKSSQATPESGLFELEEKMKNSAFEGFAMEMKNCTAFDEGVQCIQKHKEAILSNIECLFLYMKLLIILNNKQANQLLEVLLVHTDIPNKSVIRKQLSELKDRQEKTLFTLAFECNNEYAIEYILEHIH